MFLVYIKCQCNTYLKINSAYHLHFPSIYSWQTSKNTRLNAVDFRSALNPVTPKKRDRKQSTLSLITTLYNWTLNFITTEPRQFSLADFLHSTAHSINVTCRMKHGNVAVHIVFLPEQVVFVHHLNKKTVHGNHVLEELCLKTLCEVHTDA